MNNWIGVSAVLDYLEKEGISFDYDEHGLDTEKGHIDVYDGMTYKKGEWSIDWEDSPECKTTDVESVLDGFEVA